jgi:hypothetical protein
MGSTRRLLTTPLVVLSAVALAATTGVAAAAAPAATSAPVTGTAQLPLLGRLSPLTGLTAPPASAGGVNGSVSNSAAVLFSELSGVTCVTLTDCWAVGATESSGGGSVTLVEQNTGSGWQPVTSPNVPSSIDNQLAAVACPSAGDCWAVGTSQESTTTYPDTLIEQDLDGVWTVVASPDATTTDDNELYGIACPTSTLCWAVGSYDTASGYQSLMEEYTPGSGWQIVPTPGLGSLGSELEGVGCASASDCWAVGYETISSGAEETVVEQDAGSGWVVVSSPSPAGTGSSDESVLYGVACASASDCWTVGGYETVPGDVDTLVEQDTGSGWAVVASPNVDGDDPSLLYAVACPGGSGCWAVGLFLSAGIAPLVEQDTGSGWLIASSDESSSDTIALLNAVGCASGPVCWAVGYDETTTSVTAMTEEVAEPQGYTVDEYGGLHPYGNAPYEAVSAYYPGWDIVVGVVLDACDPSGQSGWTVDGYGGMHQFGAAPYVSVYGGYYPGWDIIRGAVAWCDQGQAVGYTVDAYGGMHPFSSDPGVVEPPYPQISGYWPGQELTEGIVLIPGTDEGYVVDAYGGLHPFNGAPYYSVSAYYPGFNIVRGVTLLPGGGGGYTVDAYGGLHPFGSAPYEPVSGYYAGADLITGVAASSATGGYTVDAYGGLHPYGTAPYLAVSGYYPGRDIIEGVVFSPG